MEPAASGERASPPGAAACAWWSLTGLPEPHSPGLSPAALAEFRAVAMFLSLGQAAYEGSPTGSYRMGISGVAVLDGEDVPPSTATRLKWVIMDMNVSPKEEKALDELHYAISQKLFRHGTTGRESRLARHVGLAFPRCQDGPETVQRFVSRVVSALDPAVVAEVKARVLENDLAEPSAAAPKPRL